MENLTKNNKARTNQSGFGLIQVVIAASLMSVLSLGVAGLITNQAQQISYMEDRMTHQNFKLKLGALLERNAENCTASLVGIKLNTATPTRPVNFKIKDKDGKVIFDPSDPAKNHIDKVKIDSIKLQDVDVVSGGTGSGQVKITINPVRMRKGGGPTEMIPIEIFQEVNTNISSNNEVVDCVNNAGAGMLGCVKENYKNYANMPRHTYRGFARRSYTPSRDTKVIEISKADATSNRPDKTCNGSDRNRPDCEIRGFQLVIYPGVTKYKGSVLPPGQRISVESNIVGTYDSCDNGRNIYQTSYFYGNKLIYAYKTKTSRTGCPTHIHPDPNLVANRLPPMCAVTNGRAISSLPDNFGFRFFENDGN